MLSKLFKKSSSNAKVSKIETLNAKELKNVIGGIDSTTVESSTTTTTDLQKSKHDAAMAAIQNTR